MSDEISNGFVEDEVRSGWVMPCPKCQQQIRFTVLNVVGGRDPFLYCERGSDFVLRDEDSAAVARLVGSRMPTISELRAIYDGLERNLQPCPAGGRFNRWANERCQHCQDEIPYGDGSHAEDVRYFESKVIWVKGAIAYRGAGSNSNRLV